MKGRFVGSLLLAADTLAGTSSFGMSGVNAHVLLHSPVHQQVAATANKPLPWQHSRLYVLPQPFAMCTLVASTPQQAAVTCLLSEPRLAWLRDCSIAGQPVIPPAALLELAVAAMSMLTDAEDTLLALRSLSMQSLTGFEGATTAWTCIVSVSGGIQITSSVQLLTATAARAPLSRLTCKPAAAAVLSCIQPWKAAANGFADLAAVDQSGFACRPACCEAALQLSQLQQQQASASVPAALELLALQPGSLLPLRESINVCACLQDSRFCSDAGMAVELEQIGWAPLHDSTVAVESSRPADVLYQVDWQVADVAPPSNSILLGTDPAAWLPMVLVVVATGKGYLDYFLFNKRKIGPPSKIQPR